MLIILQSLISGDIIVPLSKLIDDVKKAYELSEKYGVKVAIFGHLGDGNIHADWTSDRDITRGQKNKLDS